ncbi:MAG: type I DNA topoisomerase [Candidatus Omnitrophica bacterium]|nr:type I DNA topoisomerase [Candidatus Omnitrophota bacterium]
MTKAVVIVESPAKVKTINKFLGEKFKVLSSMGHLIDLPKSTLGVEIEDNFKPKFIVLRDKSRLLTKLKKDVKSAKEIYFATDPDREGEAIGWNLIEHIGDGKKVYRVTFQEITKEAVLEAFRHPREFDRKKIDAQVARRILDRIVGYKISPLLWKKVGSRMSAGRVQSVALRIIVDREREIKSFVPREYWQISVDLQKQGYGDLLNASLEKMNGEKVELADKAQTDKILGEIKNEKFVVSAISKREVQRRPGPPLITSTLQQEAFNKLRFNANRTMLIAQQLYEGIELGNGEVLGLVTYMRTDSVNISADALARLRGFIKTGYGNKYLPDEPNKYKSKKSAQEAHEAIRPTDVLRKPEDVRPFLDPDQYKLYELIWRRYVSAQMTAAVYEQKRVEVQSGKYQWNAAGSTLLFDGFLALIRDEQEEETKIDFSHYAEGDVLKLIEVHPTQHFTKPPPRFSDASLVKALEEDGIGRPSTYASILETLVYRNYVVRERGYLSPTELGIAICDLLVEYFARIMDVGFTAHMEENLDLVEEGKLQYPQLLAEFYQPFQEELAFAESNIIKQHEFVDKYCPQCGKQMVVKWGRRGKFLSCSGFPECKFAQPFTTGIKCPEKDCGGELIKRQSRRGAFYGCSHYPKCTYVSKELPGEQTDNLSRENSSNLG